MAPEVLRQLRQAGDVLAGVVQSVTLQVREELSVGGRKLDSVLFSGTFHVRDLVPGTDRLV
jgi:hypothetical protein